MTPDQKRWLDKNRSYRAVAQAGGNAYYTRTGMLHPNGEFELKKKDVRLGVQVGSFEVGVLMVREN